MSSRLDFVQRANAPYIEELYSRYLHDPQSVPEEWALFFAGFDLAGRPGAPAGPNGVGPEAGTPHGGLFGLIQQYRVFGHLAARLDPLGDPPPMPAALEPSALGFSDSDLAAAVDPRPFWKGEPVATVRDLVTALRETYCGAIGVEYMWIVDEDRRAWLQERMEPVRNRPALASDERLRILRQMLTADALEEFLHARYVGQKRFSLEGAASLIPMLAALIEAAGAAAVEQIVIGMPHRGPRSV